MRTRLALVAVPAIAVAALAVSAAGPVHADPGVQGCVNAVGVSACTNVGVNVPNIPNINAVANAIPNIPVPNINIPHINPLRGRY